jgi:hypothetical protein
MQELWWVQIMPSEDGLSYCVSTKVPDSVHVVPYVAWPGAGL